MSQRPHILDNRHEIILPVDPATQTDKELARRVFATSSPGSRDKGNTSKALWRYSNREVLLTLVGRHVAGCWVEYTGTTDAGYERLEVGYVGYQGCTPDSREKALEQVLAVLVKLGLRVRRSRFNGTVDTLQVLDRWKRNG